MEGRCGCCEEQGQAGASSWGGTAWLREGGRGPLGAGCPSKSSEDQPRWPYSVPLRQAPAPAPQLLHPHLNQDHPFLHGHYLFLRSFSFL